MRRVPLVAIMIGLVGAVLAVSVWTVHRANREVLRDFRGAQTRLAQDTASALHAYLDWFDRDTRLLATVASGTRKQAIGQDAQAKVILNAFDAVVTSVLHYRTIALVHPGREPIVAVDPNEDRPRIVAALAAANDALAKDAIRKAEPVRAGPLVIEGARTFYLYAAPSGPDEAVVVSSDATLLFESVSRRPTDALGLIIVDPSGAAWLGCEQRQRCRLSSPNTTENAELLRAIAAGARDERGVAEPAFARLGLPGRVIVGEAPPLSSPLGGWSVDIVARAAFDVRQEAFLRQLVITSIGVATAMLTVGLLVLRQHAAAAALGARLQAAEEVAKLQRQLVRAEKLVTVGVLSAGIAHDIGTPLAVVRGRAEHMLERGGGAGPSDAEDLRAVINEIDRISSTISQVLEFSRDQPVEIGTTDARAVIAHAVELLELRLVKKHIEVIVEAPPDLPPLAGAADRLEHVMINLLMNACDASPPESLIRVTVAREGAPTDRLSIKVVDRGAGIPPENLNAVFDPYFTTKKRGEGAGLGLAMVSQIVRSHRGEISLKSAVGLGTIATVSWPIAPPEAHV